MKIIQNYSFVSLLVPGRLGDALGDMRSGDPARPAGNHSVLTLVGRADGQRTGGRLPCGDSILVWYARTAGACTPMLAQTLFITS